MITPSIDEAGSTLGRRISAIVGRRISGGVGQRQAMGWLICLNLLVFSDFSGQASAELRISESFPSQYLLAQEDQPVPMTPRVIPRPKLTDDFLFSVDSKEAKRLSYEALENELKAGDKVSGLLLAIKKFYDPTNTYPNVSEEMIQLCEDSYTHVDTSSHWSALMWRLKSSKATPPEEYEAIRERFKFWALRQHAKALELAASGCPHSQFHLYLTYSKGDDEIGESKDLELALAYLKEAANAGHRASTYRLGVAYIQGVGVAQNYSRAYFWLSLAAKFGDEDAVNLRDLAAERLSSEELKAVAEAVEEFKPRQFPKPRPAPKKVAPENQLI